MVKDWAWEMVKLWRMYQGGMGAGLLPDAGGLMDQPVIMMEAFDIMSSAEAELKPKEVVAK